MNEKTKCKCPPRPGFFAGSMAAGSATEDRLIDKWEREHRHHANANDGEGWRGDAIAEASHCV